jgi:hypothetical protein
MQCAPDIETVYHLWCKVKCHIVGLLDFRSCYTHHCLLGEDCEQHKVLMHHDSPAVLVGLGEAHYMLALLRMQLNSSLNISHGLQHTKTDMQVD